MKKLAFIIMSLFLLVPNIYGDDFEIHVPIDVDAVPDFKNLTNNNQTFSSSGIKVYVEILNCTNDQSLVIKKDYYIPYDSQGINFVKKFTISSEASCTKTPKVKVRLGIYTNAGGAYYAEHMATKTTLKTSIKSNSSPVEANFVKVVN